MTTITACKEPLDTSRIAALWRINDAATPGVGAVSVDELAALIAAPEAQLILASDADGAPLGFLLLLAPGASYRSPNYRWFESRWAGAGANAFLYVDRIAVSAEARGQRIGERLYQAAFDDARGAFDVIACEVNTLPPNPGSMRFHTRLGFAQVGAAAHVPGEKEVAFLERKL